MNTKNIEQRLRYALNKQGYQLVKSKARVWSADNQQGYMIIIPLLNTVEAGNCFDLSLDDVAAFVNE